jgi:hypothetical protein
MRSVVAIAVGTLALVASLAICLAVELKFDGMVAMPEGPYMPFLRFKALNASKATRRLPGTSTLSGSPRSP